MQQTSALIDSTNPDLSAFFARGGKLIIRENAADRAQSALMGIDYYKAMVARFGQAAVDRSTCGCMCRRRPRTPAMHAR